MHNVDNFPIDFDESFTKYFDFFPLLLLLDSRLINCRFNYDVITTDVKHKLKDFVSYSVEGSLVGVKLHVRIFVQHILQILFELVFEVQEIDLSEVAKIAPNQFLEIVHLWILFVDEEALKNVLKWFLCLVIKDVTPRNQVVRVEDAIVVSFIGMP